MDGPRPKVLVVNGVHVDRFRAAVGLDETFDVVEVGSADEALAHRDPDVILLLCEERPPGAEAARLARAARARWPAATGVILATSTGEEGIAERVDPEDLWWPASAPAAPFVRALLRHEAARAARERAQLATIRALERERERLEAENRALRSFGYTVAHDLRGPLRCVAGFGDQLLDEHGERLDDQGRALLQRILQACERMDALVEGTLALARIERAELRREPIDLERVIREVVGDLRAREQAEGRPAELELHCRGPAIVEADPRLLRLAIENLVANAWKFTRSVTRPRIELGCEQLEGEHVVFVRDNGVGFGDADPELLFRPFFEAHDGAEYGGSGIGLSIVAQVVARHGGWIRAESPSEGGAIFRFTLEPRRGRDAFGTGAAGHGTDGTD